MAAKTYYTIWWPLSRDRDAGKAQRRERLIVPACLEGMKIKIEI